jgi:hypothetical protein
MKSAGRRSKPESSSALGLDAGGKVYGSSRGPLVSRMTAVTDYRYSKKPLQDTTLTKEITKEPAPNETLLGTSPSPSITRSSQLQGSVVIARPTATAPGRPRPGPPLAVGANSEHDPWSPVQPSPPASNQPHGTNGRASLSA